MAEDAAKPAKVPVSRRLQQMGFMQRALAKRKIAETAAEESSTAKEEVAEEWVTQSNASQATKCVVIMEGNPEPEAQCGRFSFNGAAPQAEQSKTNQTPQKQPPVKQEDMRSIPDEELPKYLSPQSKRRKSSHSNHGGSGKKSEPRKGSRYFNG